MLKLVQILRLTPSKIHTNSLGVHVQVLQSTIEDDDDGKGAIKSVICKTRANDGNRITLLKFHKWHDKAREIDLPVWMHCSCPYFLFYAEVALTMKGSSTILNSNGKMPKIKNPRTVPWCCKHIAAAYKFAIKAKAIDNRRSASKGGPSDADLKKAVHHLNKMGRH
jgi:hypothetical protein